MIFKLDDNWNIPCWIFNKKTRIITWTKNTERVKSNIICFEKTNSLFINDRIKHIKYGAGTVNSKLFELDNGEKSFQMRVDSGTLHNVFLKDVEKQIQKFEFVDVDPIERVFVIFIDGFKHELFHYKNGKNISVHMGDLYTIKEIVNIIAKEDGQTALLNLDAKWRKEKATEKQINYVKSFYTKNDVELNKGNCSILIEQHSSKNKIEDVMYNLIGEDRPF